MIKTKLTMVFVLIWVLHAYAQPTISYTFDDGVTDNYPGYPVEHWNQMLLDRLDSAGIKSIFFVTGLNKSDEQGQFLLRSWNDKGHKLANHTFSHPNYSSKVVTFERFQSEFLRTDSMIKSYTNYVRLFRFPYLQEGETKEKVSLFRDLMKKHNYRNGYVTIDASDWYIDSRLRTRLKDNSNFDLIPFKQFYLDHLFSRAVYYEELAFKLTGRHIKHTLLLHHSLAAALFLPDLAKMFRDKGWKIVSAEEAYKDEISRVNPSNIPAGQSLIWALAKDSGKFNLRYPAEDSRYEKDKMDKLGL